MRILITGINGFVGTYLAKELIGRNYEIEGMDIQPSKSKTLVINLLDQPSLNEGLLLCQPDYIIHLAAISSVDSKEPTILYKTNVIGTMNLLNACLHMEKLPRILFVSSSLVYGNVSLNEQPILESFPVNPANHYGASKAAAELILQAFGNEYGLEYMIARPFNHTGPGQSESFVIPKIVNCFRRGDRSISLGNISTVRDFTDVRDVVNAYADMIDCFSDKEIYNIASNKGITIQDVIMQLNELAHRKMDIHIDNHLIRKNEIHSLVGNSEKLKRQIGWQSSIPFERTLLDMLNVN